MEAASPLADVQAYVDRFNALFGLDLTIEGLTTAKESMLRRWADYRRTIHPSEWALCLQEEIAYAKYRIAQKFGLIPQDGEGDPLLAYGTVKSRFLEVMER